MHLLLDNKLAPITFEMGFLEVDHKTASSAFMEWQIPIQKKRKVEVSQKEISGSLEEVLKMLFPLTSIERRRYLFVPTNSSWCAFFDNGFRGADAMSVMLYLTKVLHCRGLRVVAIPDVEHDKFKMKNRRNAATVLEVYGPENTDFLNYLRSISACSDNGKWSFDQSGTPLPFEDLSYYKQRSIKDRFTIDLLEKYLMSLGLMAFDESFYLPPSASYADLIEKIGLTADGLKEYSIEEI